MLWEGEQGLLSLERAVEVFCQVTAELDVLLLVLAHRYMRRPAQTIEWAVSQRVIRTHRYARMSAACRTGYVNSPALSNDSSTSESSRAFRDAASLD